MGVLLSEEVFRISAISEKRCELRRPLHFGMSFLVCITVHTVKGRKSSCLRVHLSRAHAEERVIDAVRVKLGNGPHEPREGGRAFIGLGEEASAWHLRLNLLASKSLMTRKFRSSKENTKTLYTQQNTQRQ
eukprot:295231-Amphidinium_carterae.1